MTQSTSLHCDISVTTKLHKYNVLIAALELIKNKIAGVDLFSHTRSIIAFEKALTDNKHWGDLSINIKGRESKTAELVRKTQGLLYASYSSSNQFATAASTPSN